MLRSEIPQHPLHGFSKVRKFLTRTPALACGASVTRKVRMNAKFFFSRKFAPFAPFALRLHRKIKNSSIDFGKTMCSAPTSILENNAHLSDMCSQEIYDFSYSFLRKFSNFRNKR